MNAGLGIAGMFLLLAAACKKEAKPSEQTGNLVLHVSASNDSDRFDFDSLGLNHPAGYTYSVTRLQFYLSGFQLHHQDGRNVKYNSPLYFDLHTSTTKSCSMPALPPGNYTGIDFYVGLDSLQNKTGALPVTVENTNMAWPDGMGGGYHFMKLEGNFKDKSGTHGFAMHLGKNKHLVSIKLLRTFSVSATSNNTLALRMNLAEWFRNPSLYDFNTDANYSMGSDAAMFKLKNNGQDIFNE